MSEPHTTETGITTGAAAPEPTPVPDEASNQPAHVTAIPADPPSQKPEPEQASILAATAPINEAKSSFSERVTKELQNPLTKQFTDAEWEALFEFRTQLPDIFAEAFPEKPSARDLPVNVWGIEINPVTPQQDARISVVLLKFLRARNLNLHEARDMFINTLKWRESINIEAVLEESFPNDIFGGLGHVYGQDKGRRPVAYNLYGANQDLKAVFGDVDRFIRWRVAFMEKSVALLDFVEVDQMVQIHGKHINAFETYIVYDNFTANTDYEGVSLTSRDANSKAAAAQATNIFQSHYPELLYKKWFINIPTLLNWIFWIFKPLISANTLAKMSVVGTGQQAIKKALLPYIDVTQLPERYGGEAQAF